MSKSDNTLPKSEILRGRKLIKWAFKNSKTLLVNEFVVVRYCPYHERKVLFAVERGIKKAVVRNRIKRILREYYRRNKHRFKTGIWILIGKRKIYEIKSHQFNIPL